MLGRPRCLLLGFPVGDARDLVFPLNACCGPSRHLQKTQRWWLLHCHLLMSGRPVAVELALPLVPVIRPESCSLRFVFPSAAVASCDKLHLGCDAILPWGWDNSLLGAVVNLGRSGSPQGKNPVSPCVHLGLGRAAANAIR